MNTRQPTLFDDGAPAPQAAARSIVLHAQPTRPLTRTQTTFNKLIARVESLRAKLDGLKRRLEEALVFHGAQVRPRVQRLTALRKDTVRALRPFLNDRRLKRSDKRVLATIVAEQLDEILAEESTMDDDLRAVFEQVHGADLTEIEHEQMEVARSEMEAMFTDLGIDVDLSHFRPDMSEEDIAATFAEMTDQVRRQAEEARWRKEPSERKTKRELKEEERASRAEELRRKTIGTIYKQLAKVLHPDLEQDADVRQRKSTLMQDLTAAYANNDLHTLLRLELEWIHREENDVARLTDAKLAAYNQLLKEQVAELEAALLDLPYHPRYAPLVDVDPDAPFGTSVRMDGPAEVRQLDLMIASLSDTLTRLQSGNAVQEVRRAIKTYRAASRPLY